jgi:Na+/H+-translocating membrane pyrophosphatase
VTAITAFLPFEDPRNPGGFLDVGDDVGDDVEDFAGLAPALERTRAVADPRSIVAVTTAHARFTGLVPSKS